MTERIPFELFDPEAQHIVNFSGGRTSGYMTDIFEGIKKHNPNIKVEYIFTDTGAEHPGTYAFIRKVVEHYKIELTCLRAVTNKKGVGNSYRVVRLDEIRPDFQPWEDMLRKYGAPYVNGAFCTGRMKTDPIDKYLKEKYGKTAVTWLGMRIDEPKRLKNHDRIYYLADLSDAEKIDILRFWKAMPFDLEIPEYLGNCMFCLKKGTNKIALAARAEPEYAAQFHNLIASDFVRKSPVATAPTENMFRKAQSIPMILASYEGIPTEHLIAALRTVRAESGGCSESCEAFES